MSVWAAGLLEDGRVGRIAFELALEQVRIGPFPARISRLRGMFCCEDRVRARAGAGAWDRNGKSHLRKDYLAELSFIDAGLKRDRLDSNWITYAPVRDDGFLTDLEWIPGYWAGLPHPDHEPIWELLVEGRLTVLGTELRQRAYHAISSEFPDSLAFLEISRLAAQTGSDLGSIAGFLQKTCGFRRSRPRIPIGSRPPIPI